MTNYIELESLDSKTRYCLADTMAMVDLYRDALDSLDGIISALNGRTMIVIKEVIKESFEKCTEIGCTTDTLNEFEEKMQSKIHESNIPIVLGKLPKIILKEASVQHAKKEYPNRYGAPLSAVDCLLLCTAVRFPNIDIMTSDCTLSDAISKQCGPFRTCTSRTDYYRRRYNTNWFAKILAGTEVEWLEGGTMLAYVAEHGGMVVLDTTEQEARVISCDISDQPYAGDVIKEFFMMPIQSQYCSCDSGDYSDKIKCTCKDVPYKPDSGLSKMKIAGFLNSMSARNRNRLWKVVKSYR